MDTTTLALVTDDTTIHTATEAARYGIVATKCCFCRKALVDAESVRDGIGPVCAKKHGYSKCDKNVASWHEVMEAARAADCLTEIMPFISNQNARAAVNMVIYMISASIAGAKDDPRNVYRLDVIRALGFITLATHLEDRLYGEENGYYFNGKVTVAPGNTTHLKVTCERLSTEAFGGYRSVVTSVKGYWSPAQRANFIPVGAVEAFKQAIKADERMRGVVILGA